MAIVLANAPASLAQAACLMCDDLIELDQPAAECMLSRYDDFQRQIAAEPGHRASVDFGSCGGTRGPAGERGSLGSMPDPMAPKHKALKRVYFLDEASLACLRAKVATHQMPLDPSAEFDLLDGCNAP